MSVYHPLRDRLRQCGQSRLRLTFGQIEEILERPLPPSAFKFPAWWSNERSGSHVQKQGWMDAGYRTAELDLPGGSVTFVRT